MRTKKQLEQQFRALIVGIEINNPFDTFEPHPGEEGTHNIWELYEARLNLLIVDAIQQSKDKELTLFFLETIANELEQKH